MNKSVLTILLVSLLIAFSLECHSQEDSFTEIKTEKAIQDAGDVIHLALPALAGLSTLVAGDKEGSFQFLKSFSINLAATYALKYAINKDRPDGATDGHAFPSGHTSVAFQSASFIQRRYGWEYGIPAFVLAGFVAYSRIEGLNDRHDSWDVLGGIIVGLGSTYLFTTPYEKDHFELTYSSQNGKYLLGLAFKF